MTTSRFSVLLPVYAGDRADFLRRAFASVTTDQTLTPAEVVVVRDGPVGPELQEVLDALEMDTAVPTRIVEIPVNGGLARALQVGLEACEHEIVARMDADDISLPERFARQIPLVDGGLDIVGSAIREFTEEEELGLVRTPPLTTSEIAVRSRFVSPFNHPTVVFRKTAVRSAGGYEDLAFMEDYWLFARMILVGARTQNVAEPLVLYRVGAGAYRRRGGLTILGSELALQRKLLVAGFTTRGQFVRNIILRGGYRLVPEGLRRRGYRRFITSWRT